MFSASCMYLHVLTHKVNHLVCLFPKTRMWKELKICNYFSYLPSSWKHMLCHEMCVYEKIQHFLKRKMCISFSRCTQNQSQSQKAFISQRVSTWELVIVKTITRRLNLTPLPNSFCNYCLTTQIQHLNKIEIKALVVDKVGIEWIQMCLKQ